MSKHILVINYGMGNIGSVCNALNYLGGRFTTSYRKNDLLSADAFILPGVGAFKAAMENGYLILVLIAMGNVVISVYYYLLILKAAYLKEPDTALPELTCSTPLRILTAVLIVVIVLVGIFPTPFIDFAQDAVRTLM